MDQVSHSALRLHLEVADIFGKEDWSNIDRIIVARIAMAEKKIVWKQKSKFAGHLGYIQIMLWF